MLKQLKEGIIPKYFDLQNLPQNMKFVAFGMDTMGVLGPEAVNFVKEICNYFPNGMSAQLKHRMKMLISTYICRGKDLKQRRFATDFNKYFLKTALHVP